MEDQKSLIAVLCGRPNQFVICIPIQYFNRRRGVLTELIPNSSNFDSESASRYLSGRRRGIAHGGVGRKNPHKMYPVHQSCPYQVEKSH
jgi:hypothetical protein